MFKLLYMKKYLKKSNRVLHEAQSSIRMNALNIRKATERYMNMQNQPTQEKCSSKTESHNIFFKHPLACPIDQNSSSQLQHQHLHKADTHLELTWKNAYHHPNDSHHKHCETPKDFP